VTWGGNIPLLPYGDNWPLHRKTCHETLSEKQGIAYRPPFCQKVHQILEKSLLTPEQFEAHRKLYVLTPNTHVLSTNCRLFISVPENTMYGYDLQSLHDPCIEAAEGSMVIWAIGKLQR